MQVVSQPVPRVDAREKITGQAQFLADIKFENMLFARAIRSEKPRAKLKTVRYPDLPVGYAIVDFSDIPAGGTNHILMIDDDWPVFAHGEVRFVGQTIALVVGPDRNILAHLMENVSVEYEDLEPAVSLEQSEACVGGPIHGKDNLFADYTVIKGDPEGAFQKADVVFEEEFCTGYQEHVYMEPQGCVAIKEQNRIVLYASMQCPFYLQKSLAHTMGLPRDSVRVVQPHVGGGFGGKEHYPDVLATQSAVAAWKLEKPVQMVLERSEDILCTPKRHPSSVKIRGALETDGSIMALDIDTRLNAGAYATCSTVVLQRAVFSATGVYDLKNVKIRGRAFATNMVPSDAFRGFGAPQALFAIEMYMNHLAARNSAEVLSFKKGQFLKKASVTVTGGQVYDNVMLNAMSDRVLQVSDFLNRRQIAESGRGIGISFFNHGCAFTGSGEGDLIKSRVRLQKGADDTVRILAAGVDMGQGVLTTFCKVVSFTLGIPISQVLYDRPDTDKVPDSGPTCASRSIMVVGYLLQEAAKKLKNIWKSGEVQEAVQGYHHPEQFSWNQEQFKGDAYPSYGWGINVIEVTVDPITYEVTVLGIWTIYDVGVPIDRRIVEGQVHGGMVQALGYAGLEKLQVSNGRFLQGNMADYVIPTAVDYPKIHTEFLEDPYEFGPFGAKGAGELVFDGAAPAYAMAVEQAIGMRIYQIPVTPEYIMELLHD